MGSSCSDDFEAQPINIAMIIMDIKDGEKAIDLCVDLRIM